MEKIVDFEKLNIAFDLAKKYSLLSGEGCSIYFEFEDGYFSPRLFYFNREAEYEFAGDITCDDIIEKLKKLMQKENKHKIGEMVWFIHWKMTGSGIIPEIGNGIVEEICFYEDAYIVGGRRLDENKVYGSREALTSAQVKFWSSL